ncbi:helicase associated domain-containing protein [Yinghuangia aomiensis]
MVGACLHALLARARSPPRPAGPPRRSYPLGIWINRQRTVYAAGTLTGLRVQRLEGLGMVWDYADEAFDEGLAAARAYFADHGTLAAPQTATAPDRPVGQWLSNQRRPGFLAGHPERAEALAAIEPDWNPAWPLDWQRHYAGVRESLTAGAKLDELIPGVTIHGRDSSQGCRAPFGVPAGGSTAPCTRSPTTVMPAPG